MSDYEASRTLVKSPPELWAELSDQVSLAGHLAEPFGEIRITRLEPETAVAWEGERASGTVRIEPAGWGTRVTLTARAAQGDHQEAGGRPEPPAPEPAPLPRPTPVPEPLPPAAEEPPTPAAARAPRRGLRGLLFGWLKARPEPPLDDPPATKSEDNPTTRASAPLEAEPASVPDEISTDPPPPAEAARATAMDPDAALVSVLDRLGAAHHRPFSRS